MPTYTFARADGATTQRKLTFDEYDKIQQGLLRVTDEDGAEMTLVFNPQNVGFVLKDGPSGGWTSKAMKENRYRRERSEVMSKRERDHVFKTKLIPNYRGQEAHSWKDIQDEVRSKEGPLAASTYDAHVAQEKV